MLNDEVINAEAAAKVLHIGRNAVYELAKSGKLPSYKVGRKLLFSLRDLQAYMESLRSGGPVLAGDASAATGASTAVDASSPEQGSAFAQSSGRRTLSVGSFVLAGHGSSAGLVVDRLQTLGMPAYRQSLNSYDALVAMYNGQTQAAFVHLYDQRTNSYNIPYVQRLLPGTSVIVFRLMKRWQGFAVAPGNPKAIASWGALLRANIRLANRQRGCGSRVLMDEKLLSMGAVPSVISGYGTSYDSGLAAADAVARGLSDVAVVGEQIAAQIAGIDFVRQQSEWLDLVVSKEGSGRELARAIKSFFDDDAFKQEYARVVHGDGANLGAIIYES